MRDDERNEIVQEIRNILNGEVHEAIERIKGQYKIYEDKLEAELDRQYEFYLRKIEKEIAPKVEKAFSQILVRRCQKIADRVQKYLQRY